MSRFQRKLDLLDTIETELAAYLTRKDFRKKGLLVELMACSNGSWNLSLFRKNPRDEEKLRKGEENWGRLVKYVVCPVFQSLISTVQCHFCTQVAFGTWNKFVFFS